MLRPRLSALVLAPSLLLGACASNYFVDAQRRYHVQLPPRMGVGEGANRIEAEHYDLDAKIKIDVVETSASDLDAYLASMIDATTLASGDRDDTMVGPLSATRLEFRGGVDLGRGFAVAPNLVVYLVMHESTVYRLSCAAPDGPFESFCIDTFTQVVDSFGLGPAPTH